MEHQEGGGPTQVCGHELMWKCSLQKMEKGDLVWFTNERITPKRLDADGNQLW